MMTLAGGRGLGRFPWTRGLLRALLQTPRREWVWGGGRAPWEAPVVLPEKAVWVKGGGKGDGRCWPSLPEAPWTSPPATKPFWGPKTCRRPSPPSLFAGISLRPPSPPYSLIMS